jgi:hypothetical protein
LAALVAVHRYFSSNRLALARPPRQRMAVRPYQNGRVLHFPFARKAKHEERVDHMVYPLEIPPAGMDITSTAGRCRYGNTLVSI